MMGAMTSDTRVARIRRLWPASRRRRIAAGIAIVAIFVATLIASSRLLRLAFDDLNVLAYLGLFAACWVGAGGALVPVPGVRPISWLMVIQQGAALDPVVVAGAAAIAMAAGQSSYFLAARAAMRRHERSAGTAGSGQPDPVTPEVADPPVALGAAVDDGVGEETKGVLARTRERVQRRVVAHATGTAFLVSMIPSPLTTLATTASAAAGTPYAGWIAPTLGGYLTFCAILAVVGQGLLLAIRSVLP
jgi:hypothetical protein